MPGPLLPDDARSVPAARPRSRPPVDPDAPTVRPGLRADPVADPPTVRPRPRAVPAPPAPRPADAIVPEQAVGDDLALQFPAWDLVPPVEFVVRHRRPR